MAARHKAIGNPVRLRILRLLCREPLHGCEIAAALELAPSTVSEHLAALRRAGLIEESRHGRWVEFRQTLPADLICELTSGDARPPQVRDVARDLPGDDELCNVRAKE